MSLALRHGTVRGRGRASPDDDTDGDTDDEAGGGSRGVLVKKKAETNYIETFVKVGAVAISAFAIYSIFKPKNRR